MLIGFEQAFDSVSWRFLYKAFEFFGFGTSFIQWIRLFNRDVTATILQMGHMSKEIFIKRGCRQGDPIAPYLFIICSEILCQLLVNNETFKGITI